MQQTLEEIKASKIPWEAPTLMKALREGTIVREHDRIVQGRKGYNCDCGSCVQDFRMTDVRGIPHLQEDFLCDGCTTDLERRNVNIDGRENTPDEWEWRRKWVRLLGAPPAMITAMKSKADRFK